MKAQLRPQHNATGSFALTTKLRPRQNVCRAPATGGVSAAASTAKPTEADSNKHPTSARRNLSMWQCSPCLNTVLDSPSVQTWRFDSSPSMCLSSPSCSSSLRQAGSWKGRRCSKPPAAHIERTLPHAAARAARVFAPGY